MSDPDDIRNRLKKPLQRPSQTQSALNLPAKRLDVPEDPPPAEESHPGSGGGLARMLSALAKMLTPKPNSTDEDVPKADPPVFTVLVAAMAGDAGDGAGSQQLFRMLALLPTLKVKPLAKPFQLDSLEDPANIATTQAAIRQTIAAESADLMVWGDMVKDGYRLRLTAASAEDDRTLFGISTRIELPITLGEPQLYMLHAAILAAADCTTEVQKAAIRKMLPSSVAPLEALAAKPPLQMSMPQQRSAQLTFGHVAIAIAQAVPPSQADTWLEKAVNSYRAAEKRVGRTDPAWEGGLVQKHLANALTLRAERSKEQAKTYLEEAVKAWRTAAEAIPKGTMVLEWAAVQTRLGTALYRLDLITGDTGLLREAVQVLQQALTIYSRTETPQRWADIMHTLAQVLEVYGEEIRSAEVLRRAIDACDAVMEIRTRDRTPLAWASIQNTLGSALFMLDKHSDGARHLPDAIAAFQGALEVFQTQGRKGPAQVAARNLAKAQKLAEDRKGRQVANPDWAQE